jgi:iron(II)-dependent oxidoreductase
MSRLPVAVFALAVSACSAAAQDEEPIAGNPLIPIEGGAVIFGNDEGNENEGPEHIIDLRGFAMNQTEVTSRQYRRFSAETGHRVPFYSTHPVLGLDDHPAVGLSWSDANNFCAHYGLSLPSEQEFERAARGHDGGRFPWGEAPADATRASGGGDVCCTEDERDGYPMTAPVGSFPAGNSPEGLADLIGNVWEWTRDYYAPYEGEAPPDIAQKFRVLRGGAWNSDPAKLSATYRLAFDPDFRFAANGGFRCVRSPG